MKQIRLWMLTAILTLCGTISALAQIDPQVTEIMQDNYYFREMKAKQSGVSMTMTVSKIKFGVSDDVFKFDPKNYPNAIIVRK